MMKTPDIISGFECMLPVKTTWNTKQIPAFIDRLWNVRSQMGVEYYWPADLD